MSVDAQREPDWALSRIAMVIITQVPQVQVRTCTRPLRRDPAIMMIALAIVAAWSPPVLVSDVPRIYIIDEFATAAECSAIYNEAAPIMWTATTMDASGNTQAAQSESPPRIAQDVTLHPNTWSSAVASVVERMDAAALQPSANGQHLTVAEYEVGGVYELHTDSSVSVGRLATAILFLQPADEGGELVFPWADTSNSTKQTLEGVRGTGRPAEEVASLRALPQLRTGGMCHASSDALLIEPRVGRLVIFFNHDSMGRTLKPRTFHGSCPVGRGTKRVAQRFYQWHALDQPNTLGSLIEQVGLSRRWTGL